MILIAQEQQQYIMTFQHVMKKGAAFSMASLFQNKKTIISVFLLLFLLLSSCQKGGAKHPVRYEGSLWVSEEPYMSLYYPGPVGTETYEYAILDGVLTRIDIVYQPGASCSIYTFGRRSDDSFRLAHARIETTDEYAVMQIITDKFEDKLFGGKYDRIILERRELSELEDSQMYAKLPNQSNPNDG